jgi:hypothetical protein
MSWCGTSTNATWSPPAMPAKPTSRHRFCDARLVSNISQTHAAAGVQRRASLAHHPVVDHRSAQTRRSDRREVENVLRCLYPQHEEPTVAMLAGDAADPSFSRATISRMLSYCAWPCSLARFRSLLLVTGFLILLAWFWVAAAAATVALRRERGSKRKGTSRGDRQKQRRLRRAEAKRRRTKRRLAFYGGRSLQRARAGP